MMYDYCVIRTGQTFGSSARFDSWTDLRR